jgi:ACS family hexuronate transporter-like MFS transporter
VASPSRKWWICGLLLLASAINYMDRQTLAGASVRITREMGLNQEHYGDFEAGFGGAFAVGSIVFGILADRLPLRWLYAAVVALWSAAGIATGFAKDYHSLLWCRIFLGFFEAGHWPCGVKATRALLDARDRSLGNGVLQSGASTGAIITPIILRFMMTDEQGSWRFAFQVVGAIGFVWLIAWLLLVRRTDFSPAAHASSSVSAEPDPGIKSADASQPARTAERFPVNSRGSQTPGQPTQQSSSTPDGVAQSTQALDVPWHRIIFSRRMAVVLVVIALINTTWQILRAWLPKFLQEGRGYTESDQLYFTSIWFAVTDIGCLAAGALAFWLCRRGMSVMNSRLLVFGICAVLCAVTLALPYLPQGWLLLAVLLIAGAGALGVFPVYHAFTQDLSGAHQGKVTGVAGIAAWGFSPLAQKFFGRLVDRTGSFDAGLAVAGVLPLIALLFLIFFWKSPAPPTPEGSSAD